MCTYVCVYVRLYNDVNATRFVIGHCPWYIRVYIYMDDVTVNLFSLFCLTWSAVLKMFVRLFRIFNEQVKALQKV